MTEFFSQQQIDDMRECFNLYSDGGVVHSPAQLRCILRSLGYATTQSDSLQHFKQCKRPLDFASFLHVAHAEQRHGDPTLEVIRALRGIDRQGNRAMSATELRSILCGTGERMHPEEVDLLLSQISVNGLVPHQKLIELIASPAI